MQSFSHVSFWLFARSSFGALVPSSALHRDRILALACGGALFWPVVVCYMGGGGGGGGGKEGGRQGVCLVLGFCVPVFFFFFLRYPSSYGSTFSRIFIKNGRKN